MAQQGMPWTRKYLCFNLYPGPVNVSFLMIFDVAINHNDSWLKYGIFSLEEEDLFKSPKHR